VLRGKLERWLRIFVVILGVAALAQAATAQQQWIPLGPDGGDARSLTHDPANPDRIFLGTSSGWLYLSTDGGASWSRFAHLGNGDYVLDHVQIDPSNSNIMYVAAWSAERVGGDLFKTTDGGRTWNALPGMHDKSIRAMALAPSDPKVLVTGALDGVFRSTDGGKSWRQISPPNHAEIKNIESIAIDPQNPDVIYAGTWHLPWKTPDGGKTWQHIKNGVIDDSDVFSIIVDPKAPSVVYASACSGIYKSENGGDLFKKAQGIPFSARRTRVLHQDPVNSNVVYAGTTEGLWRTSDSGKSWKQITGPEVVVNDVLIDPRNDSKIMIATDRMGVLVSKNNGSTFEATNRGFSHRRVSALVADRSDPSTLYVGLINNQEFGGVFVSHDSGRNWEPMSNGLHGRDIFWLEQPEAGALVAGTNRGIFRLAKGEHEWQPINTALEEKMVRVKVTPKPGAHVKRASVTYVERQEFVKSEIVGRVSQLKLEGKHWYAATASGLYRSIDKGRSWTGGSVLGYKDFIAVDALDSNVIATDLNHVVISTDSGNTWNSVKVPQFTGAITRVAVQPGQFWILTRIGAFRSKNNGATWEHVMVGTPASNMTYLAYDRSSDELLAVGNPRTMVFTSNDGGNTWKQGPQSMWPVHNVAVVHGKLYGLTDFDGVIAEAGSNGGERSVNAGGGMN